MIHEVWAFGQYCLPMLCDCFNPQVVLLERVVLCDRFCKYLYSNFATILSLCWDTLGQMWVRSSRACSMISHRESKKSQEVWVLKWKAQVDMRRGQESVDITEWQLFYSGVTLVERESPPRGLANLPTISIWSDCVMSVASITQSHPSGHPIMGRWFAKPWASPRHHGNADVGYLPMDAFIFVRRVIHIYIYIYKLRLLLFGLAGRS